jgi:hypothetical protein
MGSALCCNRTREGVSSEPSAIASDPMSINDLPDEICNRRREDVSFEPSTIAREPMSINDLPDEMLLKILSYCGSEELTFTIPEVCKRWDALSMALTISNQKRYTCDEYSDISRVFKVRYSALFGVQEKLSYVIIPIK